MVIYYRLGRGLFVNMTNACPCDCIFCIRNHTDGMTPDETLWLEREPTLEEIKAAFTSRTDIQELDEVVFCGFGEPMVRADDVIALTEFYKQHGIKVRLNTNGLVRLIHPGFDISRLARLDTISISLNADDEAEYLRITRPSFGARAYQEMLNFAADVRQYANVMLSVVGVLEPNRIENCRKIAESLGVGFRVR